MAKSTAHSFRHGNVVAVRGRQKGVNAHKYHSRSTYNSKSGAAGAQRHLKSQYGGVHVTSGQVAAVVGGGLVVGAGAAYGIHKYRQHHRAVDKNPQTTPTLHSQVGTKSFGRVAKKPY